MSIIRNFIIIIIVSVFTVSANSQEVKKVGKFKDWETMIIVEQTGKVCFAQSAPVLQAPKSNIREARMFVSFRPGEKVNNEISITGGYEFNKKNSITATSGKSKYKFLLAQKEVLLKTQLHSLIQKLMMIEGEEESLDNE